MVVARRLHREAGVTLTATLYDAAGKDRSVEVRPGMAKRLGRRQLLWVDLDARETKPIGVVQKALDLPDEIQAALERSDGAASLTRYPKLIHLRLIAMQPENGHDLHADGPTDGSLATAPIDIVAGPNLVVTVHHGTIQAFDAFLDQLRGETRLGALDAAGFMAALVDAVLTTYLTIVEALSRRIDALDQVAMRTRQADLFLSEIVAIRGRIGAVRRTIAPHSFAFAALARPDLDVPDLGRPWPGLIDRLQRTIDATENLREQLLGSFDVFMARSAQRTNEVMKALTIINAVLLPAVVLAGVMGMNFKLAFFEQPGNFWLVIVGMLGLAGSIGGISRWRGWI
jgi:magnesium transporter